MFSYSYKKYGDCDELYFRDYLNDNSEKAKEYENLKLYLYENINLTGIYILSTKRILLKE